MVPKLIHFVWFGCPLPRWARWTMDRWQALNPDWDVRLHGEEALAPEYADLYNRIGDRCSRSDLLRLSVLRQEGGWYIDSDFVPLLPLDSLYDEHDIEDIFLTKQWAEVARKWVANGVFAISAGSPMWDEIDKLVAETIVGKPDALTPPGTLERTSFGPLLTTQLVQRNRHIPLAEPAEWYPWRPPRAKCIDRLISVWQAGWTPESILATGAAGSVAAHLWLGGDYDIPELDALAENSAPGP